MPAKIRPDEVTVVVPTLDSGAWIGRFVDCITEALPGSAVVLVDDFSGDETRQILRSLTTDEPTLSVIENLARAGQLEATLVGCRSATSEWVITIDDDWKVTGEALQEMLILGYGCDVVYGHVRGHSAFGNLGLSRFVRRIGPVFGVPKTVCEASSTRLFRRNLLDSRVAAPLDFHLLSVGGATGHCDLKLDLLDGVQRRHTFGSRLSMATSYVSYRDWVG